MNAVFLRIRQFKGSTIHPNFILFYIFYIVNNPT